MRPSVTKMAEKDIIEYLEENCMTQHGCDKIFSKESKFLNSLIVVDGIKLTGINKTSNNNNMQRGRPIKKS